MASRTAKAPLFGAALSCLLLAAAAKACDVPVFRYALERWEPHIYNVAIFHKQELTAEQKKVVDFVNKAAANEDAPCNVDIHLVDASKKMNEHVEAIYKTLDANALPQMVICYPLRYGAKAVAWSGPVSMEPVKGLVDSPIRRKIAEGITRGTSAVWVLLESGDKKKDAAAAKVLADTLTEAQKVLKLPVPPEMLAQAGDIGTDGMPPLKVAFSMLRMSRTDAAEKMFIHLLLHTEEDLATEYAGEPMAFAFFGQGRAMWALVGKGINRDNIGEICAFLVDRCSCQVKDQNPGVDMPFTADWYAMYDANSYTAPALPTVITPTAVTSAPAGAPAVADANAAGRNVASLDVDAGGDRLLHTILIVFGCMAAAAAVLVVWVLKRPART